MSKLPQIILDEWKNNGGAPVVTTVSSEGVANSIYATCVSIYKDEYLMVANNFFNKTFANVKDGCKGNFLFLTEEGKSYQLKGTFTHYDSGEYFDNMKCWNSETLPGVGVIVLNVDEIYSGADKIL